jgi:hypothetical protein
MTRRWALCLLAACAAAAFAAPAAAQSRGELLYTTHCVACHGTQIHWRDKRLVTDWGSLLVQVRRWQSNAALGWSEEDVLQVARHLNDTIYRLPRPLARQALMVTRAQPARP